jgi:hypothetical protein
MLIKNEPVVVKSKLKYEPLLSEFEELSILNKQVVADLENLQAKDAEMSAQ